MWSAPTGRVRQMAQGMAGAIDASVVPELRPIAGEMAGEERFGMWARGEDGWPEGGESLADDQARVLSVLARVRRELGEGGRGVGGTHGDIAALMLGELEGVPLLERPGGQMLAPGRCAVYGFSPEAQA